jgi:hypothetical protein
MIKKVKVEGFEFEYNSEGNGLHEQFGVSFEDITKISEWLAELPSGNMSSYMIAAFDKYSGINLIMAIAFINYLFGGNNR